MEAVYTFNEDLIRQVHNLYLREWWSQTRTMEETQRAVANSQLVVGLVDGLVDGQGKLVAFARVLTDFVFKALILDVIVVHNYRGVGFGEQLMATVVNHPSLAPVKHFELYCLPEMRDFYIRCGFAPDASGLQLMRRINEDRVSS